MGFLVGGAVGLFFHDFEGRGFSVGSLDADEIDTRSKVGTEANEAVAADVGAAQGATEYVYYGELPVAVAEVVAHEGFVCERIRRCGEQVGKLWVVVANEGVAKYDFETVNGGFDEVSAWYVFGLKNDAHGAGQCGNSRQAEDGLWPPIATRFGDGFEGDAALSVFDSYFEVVVWCALAAAVYEPSVIR